jgi:hypothetical protein
MVFQGKDDYIFPNICEIDFYGTQKTAPTYKNGQFMYNDNYSPHKNTLVLEINSISEQRITGTWRDSMKLNEVNGEGWFVMTAQPDVMPKVEVGSLKCLIYEIDGVAPKDLQVIAAGTAAGPVGSALYLPTEAEDAKVDCGTWTAVSNQAYSCVRNEGDFMSTNWTTTSTLYSDMFDYTPIFANKYIYEYAMIGTGDGVSRLGYKYALCK